MMGISANDALRYPFASFKRLFNYYWLFSIVGTFAYLGYYIRIIQSILADKDSELPAFGNFWANTKKGAKLMVLMITLFLAIAALRAIVEVSVLGFLATAASVYLAFIMPILLVQYAATEKFSEGCNISRASRTLCNNFWCYISVLLKIFVIEVVYILASIFVVTLIVTMPASRFSQDYLFAQFYKKALEREKAAMKKAAHRS